MNESLDASQQCRMEFEDFQKFLYVASNISITTSPECEEILIRYLEALRSRDDDNHYTAFEISFKKLITVAAAHAKLCLRNMILVDDAVVRYFI